MKKIILAIMAAVICTGAFAQGPQRGERREFKPEDFAKRQAERIQKTCDTTDEQYEALYAYFLREMKTMQAQRPQVKTEEQPQRPTEEEMKARRAEMEKRQQAQNDTIKSILNAEQYAKYEKMQKEQRQRGPQGGQGGRRGGQPQGGSRNDQE